MAHASERLTNLSTRVRAEIGPNRPELFPDARSADAYRIQDACPVTSAPLWTSHAEVRNSSI